MTMRIMMVKASLSAYFTPDTLLSCAWHYLTSLTNSHHPHCAFEETEMQKEVKPLVKSPS